MPPEMSQNPPANRPPALPPLQPAAAAALWDLHMAGVTHDFGSLPPAAPDAPAPLPAEAPAPLVVVSTPAEKPRVAIQPPASVWAVQAEGTDAALPAVVLVVAGTLPGKLALSQDAQALVRRMLAAVGLGANPMLWLNVQRGSGEQAALCAELGTHLTTTKQPVLLLGKDMLSTLAGRNLAPDQWDGLAIDGVPGNACLGATYAPDYLLAQPIAKKKAWGHLLNWQARL